MPDETADPARRRVVLTGAAGRIGVAVAGPLRQRWDLWRSDQDAGHDEHGTVSALAVTDLGACRAAFAGADAVVHLAGNPSPDATFEELLGPNVVGVRTVAQAAADAGVRRLVLASSLHAVSAVPQSVQRRTGDQPRPANLYGATKAWSEAVGAWIAATTGTSVVALRIGYFHVERPSADDGPHELTAWLSGPDAAELVRAAVEADLPTGVDGFVVVHGVSANRHNIADLEETRRTIGYAPRDDAWDGQDLRQTQGTRS